MGLVPLIILAASLLGSLHCVGMCGPIYLSLIQNQRQSWFYQLGRMTSYTLIGALAGWVGHSVFTILLNRWLQIAFAVALGATLILIGLRSINGIGSVH